MSGCVVDLPNGMTDVCRLNCGNGLYGFLYHLSPSVIRAVTLQSGYFIESRQSTKHHGRPDRSFVAPKICNLLTIAFPPLSDVQRMDNSGALRPLDESLLRELPQLGASLRIAPLREPVSSRTLSAPSPLEPNASGGARESSTSINAVNTTASGGNHHVHSANAKAGLPTVTEFLHAARAKKAEPATDPQSNVEPPPRPILPAFVNLRALERFPFASSFDDDALNGPRKRRRLDLQPDSFSEHLQLPIPQAQKEQRPPPFGPFAILNGLNEPPPNAAILPPIEAGSSISQLLTKPSRNDPAVDPGNSAPTSGVPIDGQPLERREAKLEEILGATLDENDDDDIHDPNNAERSTQLESEKAKSSVHEENPQAEQAPTPAPESDVRLSPRTRGRSRKNVRKWTEEETNDLLRGVVKCGIGNWTTILAQPELKFNKRTASNLKDRFRVCCPWAYRASDPNEATKQLRDKLADNLLKAQAQSADDAASKMPPPRPSLPTAGSSSSSGSSFGSSFGSSRASLSSASSSHRPSVSSMSSATPDTDHGSISTQQTPPPAGSPPSVPSTSQHTLESLGIPEAHVAKKPKRRSRRPFTAAEDEALLRGYAVHGFQWTLIQQDQRLHLGHRRATDLRDRFRTKFPHAYRDGGSVSGQGLPQTPGPTAGLSQPVPQDRLHGSQGSPAPALPHPHAHHRGVHTRHPSAVSNSNQGPIDPALLPPPQGFSEPSASNMPTVSGLLSFPLDENAASNASGAWEDNTLAPMVWDDLG